MSHENDWRSRIFELITSDQPYAELELLESLSLFAEPDSERRAELTPQTVELFDTMRQADPDFGRVSNHICSEAYRSSCHD